MRKRPTPTPNKSARTELSSLSGDWLNDLLGDELTSRAAAHQLRQRIPIQTIDAVHVEIDGRRYVNFASNNYLGLTHHPAVIRAGAEAMKKHGAGSGASGLVSGYTRVHESCEAAIAKWKGTAGAVLLPSGYQTAHTIVHVLAAVDELHAGGVRFLFDKLCHASLVDAIAGSGKAYRVFPHNNLAKLERLLVDAPAGQMQVVVSESIFSMDGDAVDLVGLAELKKRHEFLLVLDEAHGSGVYGEGGAGYAAEKGLQSAVDVSLVTLSKAVGVSGGAVCGSKEFCEAVVNWGRAYVYSTSVPPGIVVAIEEAIGVMKREPQRQRRVRELARRVRGELRSKEIVEGDSPIIPIVLGSEERALEAARSLREKGLLVIAIRPPTVARGTSRLRITLSCDHSDEEIEQLIEALREI